MVHGIAVPCSVLFLCYYGQLYTSVVWYRILFCMTLYDCRFDTSVRSRRTVHACGWHQNVAEVVMVVRK